MDILESLKNLNVSEECLRDIVGIVEYHICEVWNNNSGRNSIYVDSDEDDRYHAKKYGVQYHDREMSPDQYIKRATSINNKAQGLKYKPKTVEKMKRVSLNNNSIEDLKDKIKDPSRSIDIPYLDYSTGDQEGYHRAIAAKDAGIEKIPVRVFHSIKKGGNYIKKS
jgi:hypothetical protein